MDSLTPDALSTTEDNELICEKLLGWKQSSILGYWFPSPCHVGTLRTPSFTTWADAGLILEALQKREGWDTFQVCSDLGWRLKTRELTPFAIRAAAIEFIRSQT